LISLKYQEGDEDHLVLDTYEDPVADPVSDIFSFTGTLQTHSAEEMQALLPEL
jgi:hypothetical protein